MPAVTVTELMVRDSEGGEQIAVDIEMAGRTYSVTLWEDSSSNHELTVIERIDNGVMPKEFKRWATAHMGTRERKGMVL